LHNRTVYAAPPVGGSAYGFARSFRYTQTFGLNIPTPLLRHSLSALQMLRISLFWPPNLCYYCASGIHTAETAGAQKAVEGMGHEAQVWPRGEEKQEKKKPPQFKARRWVEAYH
jgi:hypothetical protein